ncbi:MAG: DUF1330 domain-containing protein [Bdellovibrionales bacterium CG12_big_fil_rev_8_21_14_0_65_38_15]|nr:MAG: DUF1330 domain-containing protein [Bdellovibrionales bacterium CG22_combo_CG10-13_8_21_14_all_38_13]PIQ57069.1 MAG: DUF1330 domain-containing protein [Bdellovibrionales bacterium CG12_big_fil_rev_8_21_14_0_65_38_15]PIR30099.1 MAG: DUF1330 domain-containing protein [Bdellovibrionales bacterium CG11_big_fil_rev_8_21_14_0_20_38_13]
MSYEMMVGLQVKDDIQYSNYREAMGSILATHGGGFRYDFKVSEILKNEEGRPINRVFAIYFENKEKMDAFFSNPDYLKAKSQFFEVSVDATTIISEYER